MPWRQKCGCCVVGGWPLTPVEEDKKDKDNCVGRRKVFILFEDTARRDAAADGVIWSMEKACAPIRLLISTENTVKQNPSSASTVTTTGPQQCLLSLVEESNLIHEMSPIRFQ